MLPSSSPVKDTGLSIGLFQGESLGRGFKRAFFKKKLEQKESRSETTLDFHVKKALKIPPGALILFK